jgi:hypothetical protein
MTIAMKISKLAGFKPGSPSKEMAAAPPDRVHTIEIGVVYD